MKHSRDLKWTFGAQEWHCKDKQKYEKSFYAFELYFDVCNLFVRSFRYNITTGQYPFEGDNIYRLLENIGKNQWKAPEWFQKFDANLASLILGMLQSDSQNRLTLKQIKQHTYV